jgi:hypothetical protein
VRGKEFHSGGGRLPPDMMARPIVSQPVAERDRAAHMRVVMTESIGVLIFVALVGSHVAMWLRCKRQERG